MKLSPRLQQIFNNVKSGESIVDVGTDHASLPIALIKSGKIDKAIATEYKSGPFLRADQILDNNFLKEKIELREGYGLDPLETGEVSVLIIAGMGGKLITEILSKDLDKSHSFHRVILQPMSKVEEVRKFLLHNGFRITSEQTVREQNHFYQIIIAEPGDPGRFSHQDIEYGSLEVRMINQDYIDYLYWLKQTYKKTLQAIKNSNSQNYERRYLIERRYIYINNLYESLKNSTSN